MAKEKESKSEEKEVKEEKKPVKAEKEAKVRAPRWIRVGGQMEFKEPVEGDEDY